MKEVKDTLGIKYEQYASLYNYDDEKLGKLLKYTLWKYGKEVILQDMQPIAQKRIEEASKTLEDEIEMLIANDYIFESIFNKMTTQISKSHRHWHILKENIENAKNKKKSDIINNDNNVEKEVIITSAETAKKCKSQKVKVGGQTMMIVYYDELFVPSQKEIDELRNAYDDESIVKAVREGNKDEWRTDIQSYIDESEKAQ